MPVNLYHSLKKTSSMARSEETEQAMKVFYESAE